MMVLMGPQALDVFGGAGKLGRWRDVSPTNRLSPMCFHVSFISIDG